MSEDEIPKEAFEKMLENVEQIITKDLSKDTQRARPYDGPDHTYDGSRGQTLVKGLTMRDVCDCMAMGLLDASGVEPLQDAAEEGVWAYNDLYKLEDFDPVAAIQCMSCRIEMMMGIFPNVKKIEWDNEGSEE